MHQLSLCTAFLSALSFTFTTWPAPRTVQAALPPEASSVEALFEADRAFAVDSSIDRLEGWVSWFDERGVRMPMSGDCAQGRAAIRKADMGIWGDTGLELRWDPEVGGVIADGELGFTRGRYELVKIADEGDKVVGVGTYFSIWRWTDAGWKVALDGGVADA
ncbi:MAG: ketosteroid isomerase-like protein [Chlamydiales bacterium]|jgi:ketosteroid isomerase-like protein